jgi:hypothetical protein
MHGEDVFGPAEYALYYPVWVLVRDSDHPQGGVGYVVDKAQNGKKCALVFTDQPGAEDVIKLRNFKRTAAKAFEKEAFFDALATLLKQGIEHVAVDPTARKAALWPIAAMLAAADERTD